MNHYSASFAIFCSFHQSCHTKLNCWSVHSKTIFLQSASSFCLDLKQSDCQISSIFMSCSCKCCLFNAHLFFLILYKLYSISYTFVIENNDIFSKKILLVFWTLIFLSDIQFLYSLRMTVLSSSLDSKSKSDLSMLHWHFFTTLNLHQHHMLSLIFKHSIKIDLHRNTTATRRISCNNNRFKICKSKSRICRIKCILFKTANLLCLLLLCLLQNLLQNLLSLQYLNNFNFLCQSNYC